MQANRVYRLMVVVTLLAVPFVGCAGGGASDVEPPASEPTSPEESHISQDGAMVLPAGSTVSGSVTEVVPTKKIGGQAMVAIRLTRIELPSGEAREIGTAIAAKNQGAPVTIDAESVLVPVLEAPLEFEVRVPA